MNGKFITFEGLDGSGKTTQLQLLADKLRSRSFDVTTTCEPGGTILGKQIRQVLLDKSSSVSPLTELLLFAADRAQHVQTLIRPNLERGNIVISDRYADATIAYQGAGRGFDADLIRQIINIATDGLKPDLTIFFDVSVEESLNRTTKRVAEGVEKNRLDEEKFEFYQRVRDSYLQIARNESNRFRIVDAGGSIIQVHEKVLELIALHFGLI
ncbi:MAG: dTMP kinase [Pyrinomonadaceae bacterium]|nr:dTMP kinase [Pyrinomonadaceae bacterium]